MHSCWGLGSEALGEAERYGCTHRLKYSIALSMQPMKHSAHMNKHASMAIVAGHDVSAHPHLLF